MPKKLSLMTERTKGVVAMSGQELRAELDKSMATIRIDMDELRRQGLGARFSLFMRAIPSAPQSAQS